MTPQMTNTSPNLLNFGVNAAFSGSRDISTGRAIFATIESFTGVTRRRARRRGGLTCRVCSLHRSLKSRQQYWRLERWKCRNVSIFMEKEGP